MAASGDVVSRLSPEMFFDALAVQIDGPRVWDLDIAVRWVFPGHGSARVRLHNGVLLQFPDDDGAEVAATVTVPEGGLAFLATGDLAGALAAGLTVEGDQSAFEQLLGAVQPGDPSFDIVTP